MLITLASDRHSDADRRHGSTPGERFGSNPNDGRGRQRRRSAAVGNSSLTIENLAINPTPSCQGFGARPCPKTLT